jgi:hypothetical protein
MKIIYDNKEDRYIINLEGYENITVVNTNDIVEAREYFLSNMESLFNNAVCEQLKDIEQ